ncbi:hypothetical protein U8527_17010 [Kordia algicida OT-1]|uniref:SecDF-export membrane protein gliding motility-related protein n=1 Tax=Kordia algicida OT-1 TaxID=391587 RepID=A9E2G3_9FLAO|nr:hypothetical protein [Kordia algicida]EDP95386.1 secDF-export membrane protein; gliding motility-related protein [Kordia algicida OT-1]
MNYKYLLSALLVITIFAMSCTDLASGPEKIIQFEIETEVATSEKASIIENVQNRLTALDLHAVKLVNQEQQKMTFSYRGNVEPEIIKENFSITGNLEFYEVCKQKAIIFKYLRSLDDAKTDENSEMEEKDPGEKLMDRLTTFASVINDDAPNLAEDFILGFIYKGDVAHIQPLLEKSSIRIPKIKKKVKFLLGKSTVKNQFLVYAVYVNSDEKAPLNGRYVTNAAAAEGYIEGYYEINIQMNPEGAYIWEKMTEKAYENRGNIAVVLDNIVHVAPTVTQGKITGGNTQISGSFTKEHANMLANVIQSGSIPKMKILKMGILE